MYRQADRAAERPRIVRYGPFRLKKLEVGFGLAGAVVLFAAAAIGGGERLACARTDGGEIACTHVERFWVLPDRTVRFESSDIEEVRFVPYEGSKRSERGRTELIDAVGRSHAIFDTDRDEAREAFARFDAFWRDGSARSFEHEVPPPWLAILFLVGLAGFALFVGVRALARVTSVRLTVWPQRGWLRVTRRWLGIPIGSIELRTDDVVEVRVERGGVRHFTQYAREAPAPAGRIVLVAVSGEERPVSPRMLVGTGVHDLAAGALREHLGLTGEAARPQPSHARAPAPPALPKKRWYRHPAAYLGAAVIIGLAAQGILMVHADATQGWLEVTCAHRCKMGGLECLPGGSWSSSFDPGTVVIEVWNPEIAGGWEHITIPIEQGRTTTFVCRPGGDAELSD